MSYTWKNPATADQEAQSKQLWKAPEIFCEIHNGKKMYGLKDQSGKIITNAEFDSIGPFFAGYATAVKNGKRINIDDRGEQRKASH